MTSSQLVGERRGACPPPPVPPASGRVPVPGWVVGWAELDGGCGPVGVEPRKYDGFFPLFCGKNPSHFRSPSPVPSQYEFARACLTAEVFHGSAVRGETRHQVPLSLPRSPLFPEWSAELTSGISTASWLSHGHKRGLYFPRNPAFSRAQVQSGISLHPCFLTGTSAACIFPATLPSHGHKRGQRRERM